ncbi:MAG: MFS transporter [Pseudomonadota bacterium]
MRPPASPPSLFTLILLTAATTLALSLFLPSLPAIADDFGVSDEVAGLSLSGFLAVQAAILVFLAPIADRVGRRPVLLWSMGVFALSSAGSALSPDIWTFLAFRMAQAVAILGATLAMAIVRDMRDEREAAGLIGLIGAAMAAAPMLGPMLGGLVAEAFGWRACLWLLAALGAAVWLTTLLDLGETRREGPSDADRRAASGALLGSARFSAHAICASASRVTFYVYVAGAPLAAAAFGAGAAETGVYVGAITAGFLVGSVAAARIAPHVEPTTLILTGRLMCILGPAVSLALLAGGAASPLALFRPTVLVGAGNGIGIPGSLSRAMSVRPDLSAAASGLIGALTVGAGAALAGLVGLVVAGDAAPLRFLGMLIATGVAGLGAALVAWRLDRRAL